MVPHEMHGSQSLGGTTLILNYLFPAAGGMWESKDTPKCYRQDCKTHFAWRIQNTPWPKSNFQVIQSRDSCIVQVWVESDIWLLDDVGDVFKCHSLQITVDNNVIVVRTLNKKYFKKLQIADMERCVPALHPPLIWQPATWFNFKI